MTDIIEILDFINIEYRQNHKPVKDIESIIDQYLKICKSILNENSFDKDLCIFPTFFRLTNWDNWEIEIINSYNYITFNGWLKEKLIFELSYFSVSPELSFTQNILKYNNSPHTNDIIDVLHISYGEGKSVEINANWTGNKRLDITINQNFTKLTQLIKQEYDRFLKEQLNAIPSPNDSAKYEILPLTREEQKATINVEIEELFQTIISDYKDDNLRAIILCALHYYMLIDENTELYYVFSSIISQGDELHKKTFGLGGLFVIMGKIEIDKKLFERQLLIHSNKISERIINHYNNNLIRMGTTRAAIARIINRNYAHHIGSHVSLRSTFDEIYLRITGQKLNAMNADDNSTMLIRSIVEMENKLTRYKDERNDFIAGIEENTHPVTVKFYQDIILPFIENSLLMDNLANSEEVFWETDNGKVKWDGCSRLRIRVFYKKEDDLRKVELSQADCGNMCEENNNKKSNSTVPLQEMGITGDWVEMLAIYKGIKFYPNSDNHEVCVHKLPYLKYIESADDKTFFENRCLTTDDIEVSIPGSLGTHSIYSLLENIIRNTAKHANRSDLSTNLDIIIKIQDPESKVEKSDFYNIEFTTNVPTLENGEKIEELKEKLKEELNDQCKSLGFADMRINATLLSFDEITQKNLDKSIELKSYLIENHYTVEQPVNKHALSVNLKLSKPHKIVVIGKGFNKNDKQQNKENGVWCFNDADECIKALKIKKRAFQFAIVYPKVFKTIVKCSSFDAFLQYLPWRILVPCKNGEICGSVAKLAEQRRVACVDNLNIEINASNTEKLLATCWRKWIERRWGKNLELNFYFENNEILCENFNPNSVIDNAKKNLIFFKPQILKSNDEKKKEDKRYIFYDRHGTTGIKRYYTKERDNQAEPNYDFKDCDFFSKHTWIYLDKNNPDFNILNSFKSSSLEAEAYSISMARFIESGLHRILVVDERATQIACKNAQHSNNWGQVIMDNKKYIYEAAAGQVFIADSFIINDKKILSSSKQPIISFQVSSKEVKIVLNIENKNKKLDNFDTLIIHRTMFDKLYKNKDFDKYWAIFDEIFPNIIIDTGGGTVNYNPAVMSRIRVISYVVVHKLLLNGSIAKNCLTKYL